MNTSPAIRAIRIACAVIFVTCIAGLIISSIAGNNEGWVLSIGACGASAAIILIVVSLVTATKRIPEFSDVQAEAIEQRVLLDWYSSTSQWLVLDAVWLVGG